MQTRRNFYRILQVQPDAPSEVIKSNYRTLLQKLRLHPDLGGAHSNASSINQAYQTLRDPQKRAAYDQQLLRDYHIQRLSQGHLARDIPRSRNTSTSAENSGINRRNYYRILHIQTDAPAAIITANYRIQMKKPQAPIEMIREAFETLMDPQKRKAYDQFLSAHSHVSAIGRAPAAPPCQLRTEAAVVPELHPHPRAASYRPLITRYCHFCKTPHAHSPMGDHNELCIECASPLFAASREIINLRQRGLSRVEQQGKLRLFLNWPGQVKTGTLMDLSPEGLRFTTHQRLQPEQVIKVESDQFKCVAKVLHCQNSNTGESIGSRFITILFNRQQGNFISALV